MAKYKPQKSIVSALRIWLSIATGLLVLLTGILSAFFIIAAVIIWCVTAVLYLVGYLFFIPKYAQSMALSVNEDSIAIYKGVILKRKYVVPNAKQIYAERVVTPIDKWFNLTTVNFYMTRGMVSFGGLSSEDADSILLHLTEVIKDN